MKRVEDLCYICVSAINPRLTHQLRFILFLLPFLAQLFDTHFFAGFAAFCT